MGEIATHRAERGAVVLTEGVHLNEYRIGRVIGHGGMGEVYEALDTRLQRSVALKVLPESSSGIPDALSRFEQEARVLAAINHPAIPMVYCGGAENGTQYIVQELLEGQTLRDRLRARTPLSLREIFQYAHAMADGLSAAHAKGVLHRDFNPNNIFLTKTGRLKILDFGLAKLTARFTSENSATVDCGPNTGKGVLVGTIGYMSPEQLCGKKVDERTDIFSFGAVVFEMLYGRRAFGGETSEEVRFSILNENPEELYSARPTFVQCVVRGCLQKDPEERLHSTKDIAFIFDYLLSNQDGPMAGMRKRAG